MSKKNTLPRNPGESNSDYGMRLVKARILASANGEPLPTAAPEISLAQPTESSYYRGVIEVQQRIARQIAKETA